MSKWRTESEHVFSQVPKAQIPRSAFNRSHGHKTTFNAGDLVPVFVDEVLPGDTFSLSSSFLARLSTPIVPSMDNLYLDCFFFFVPNRLLWSNWVKLMGEQLNPGDSTDYLVPQVNPTAVTGFAAGSIFDYFGLPTNTTASAPACALWSRAYNLIWNEWFRDENLQTRAVVDLGDGPDAEANYPVRHRGKRHDYFTSCLPWPQKPGPGAAYANGAGVPLAGVAPVYGKTGGGQSLRWFATSDNADEGTLQAVTGGTTVAMSISRGGAATSGMRFAQKSEMVPGTYAMEADLTQASAITINSLRQAFQIQRLLERDARGGTRYTEVVRAHFGVISPDARLQRPEYLGGGTVPVAFTPVSQTAPKAAAGTLTPQGNLAAFGTVHASGLGFSKSFTEHGVLLGMVSVRADLSYQQGMHRMFSRRSRFDFYWPAFAHLGEQAVLNKEIYCKGDANDALVFGYQERFAEYRYRGSMITGKFRSTDATPLDVWHYAQKFTALPTLGDTFIQESPPVVRNQAVTTEPQFLLDAYFSMRCVRPMPTYSVPGLLDHF